MSAVGAARLPVGVVTFLFSDMQESTRLARELGELYGQVLAEHRQVLREVWPSHGGVEFGTEGDACFVAFADPAAALQAAAAAQQKLAAHRWPHGGTVRVRIGVHSGSPKVRDGSYWGIDLHYTARLCNAAWGGQVLVSASTAALVETEVEDLGEHALKDFPAPRRVFQLPIDGAGSERFPPPRTLRAGRTNLPAMLSSLIGRERELETIRTLLSEARMLTLVGSGGVGKTRLALEAAAQLLDGTGDGVWLVDLAPLSDPDLLGREVAHSLGISERPELPILDTLVESLREARLLLVLDNCEHLVSAVAELVADLLRRVSNLAVLATSREPLGVPGERLYRVPSLSLPEPGATVDELERYEAVRLFVARAREHRPDFSLDERTADPVSAVVRRLDGIPLAIELAAARLRSLGIEDLRVRLEQSFRLLTGRTRTSLARQQTLAAMIDWSYQLLSEAERAVLARLSVFAGGFDLEAAEDVCTSQRLDDLEVIDLLGTLVDKSLVQIDDLGERVRYRLLESVRAFAADRLAEEGPEEVRAIRSAHRDHFLRMAETARSRLGASDQVAWLERLEIDHDNLRAALAHCLEDPDPEPGLRLATAAARFWPYRGYALEGADAIRSQLGRPQAAEPTPVRSRALTAAAYLHSRYSGELELAEGYAQEALSTAREHRDDHAVADALGALTRIRMQQGRAGEATDLIDEAVQLARSTGDPALLARLLRLQSGVRADTGHNPREILTEMMRLYRAAGDRIGEALTLDELGLDELIAGEVEAARVHLEQAAELAATVGNRDGELSIWLNLGLARWLDGDPDRARNLFTDALSLARRTEVTAVPYALLGLALVASDAEPERAARLHGAVDQLLVESGMDLEPFEGRLRAEDLERLRAALGPDRLEQQLAAGRELGGEGVLAERLGS